MGELEAFTGKVLKRLLHVVDLEGHGQTSGVKKHRILYKENREIEMILKGYSAAFRDLEFDPKSQGFYIPISGSSPVADGKGQMIELKHRNLLCLHHQTPTILALTPDKRFPDK